jgi:hypothetical protein
VTRFLTTRPARLTLALAVAAMLLLCVSFLVPAAPVHHFRLNGRRMTDTPLGWQDVVLAVCRVGAGIAAIAALLRHQRSVETIADIVREERATIPYDRTAGVDARGNTRVQSEPRRR